MNPSDKGNPYDLQPLIEGASSLKKVKAEKFYTLSKKGITTYLNDEPVEYIPLTDWLIERNFYEQISRKKFFKKFRRWKIIRMWRRNVLHKKREECSNSLKEKLFSLHSVFGPILSEHKKYCSEIEKYRFIDLDFTRSSAP